MIRFHMQSDVLGSMKIFQMRPVLGTPLCVLAMFWPVAKRWPIAINNTRGLIASLELINIFKIISNKQRSVIWNFFAAIDKDFAKCDLCNQKMWYKSFTSKMNRHIQRKHPTVQQKSLEGREERDNKRHKEHPQVSLKYVC